MEPVDPALGALEDLFENAPCGYLSLGPDGTILRANATFSAWTGFEPAELAHKRFQQLLNIAGQIYYETHFAPLLRMQGFLNEVALDIVGKSGERISVLVNAVERRDARGANLFTKLIVFKATDRRRYERELLEARAAADRATAELRELNATLERRIDEAVTQQLRAEEVLRQSQKMEAIGQLTGGVAHDFNNLLTLIIGGLDSIHRQVERLPPSEAMARIRRAVSMAQHGAKRAASLTGRLLALSRQQALSPRNVDPNRLVAGLADLLHRTLGETIAFETVAAADVWNAFVDPGELENVLINLAVNARDAMPNGGTLTIETGNAHLSEACVSELPDPVAPGQYICIAVSDTGHGMDPETLSRVFEPFFTTKELGKGTGLGLAQVHGFVRQSAGHIRIHSVVGQGTTVKLYLPRAMAPAAEDATEGAPSRMEGGNETILVVEDDEELRAFSVSVLDELGYRVEQARTGRQALQILQTNPDIALLFTDLVLPDGIDGQQLADEALRRRPGLGILFTTGYAHSAVMDRDQLQRNASLLGKPFTFDELAHKCRTILDARRP